MFRQLIRTGLSPARRMQLSRRTTSKLYHKVELKIRAGYVIVTPFMGLREEFEKTGTWLFQRRSYLPLLLTGLFLIALKNFRYPHQSHPLDEEWGFFCLALSLVGLGIRILTIGYAPEGTSGRGTEAPNASTLNTTGMYSLVRHPLYLGNFTIWLGVTLSVRFGWFAVVSILIFWLYYERIMFAEEEFLRKKFADAYLNWAARTPTFLPRFKNWKKPACPFSLKKVLRKEYSGFFGIIAIYTALEILEDWIVNHQLHLDKTWQAIFAVGLAVYVTLRFLKKKTRLLEDEKGS